MELNGTPARKGEFVYVGELLVDPGNTKHYRRSTKSELEQLLKAAPGSNAKDETAPFYEAQLLHYGLPRTKDKARAKWRLLDALNAGSLAVPTEMATTEASLKREYATLNKKPKSGAQSSSMTTAVQQGKSQTPAVTKAGSAITSKQKKITEANMAALSSPAAPHAPPAATSTPATKKRKTAHDNKASPKPSKVAKTSQGQKATDTAPRKTPPPSSQVSMANNVYVSGSPAPKSGFTGNYPTKQTARCSRANKSGAASVRPPASLSKPKAKAAPTMVVSSSTQGKSTATKPKPKTTGQNSTESYTTPPLDGLFEIEIMADENMFGAGHGLLQLLNFASVDAFSKNYLWGEFNFQYVEGVFKARPSSIGQKKDLIRLDLEWRGEKRPDGQFSAEPSNTGCLTIDVKGRISGSLKMQGWGSNVHFTGQRRPASVKEGPKLKERSKGSYETQWRKFKKAEVKDEGSGPSTHQDTKRVVHGDVKGEQQYDSYGYRSQEDDYFENEHGRDWIEEDVIMKEAGYSDSDGY